MKKLIPILLFSALSAGAAYKEMMDPNGTSRNLKIDYGLKDDGAKSNQSEIFQRAIDELAEKGGGRIIVPKGTYQLARVQLKTNIHLLIEAGAVIKPYWPEGTKTVVFILDAERPVRKKEITEKQCRAFVENVSIRGIGGPFIIDYSEFQHEKEEGIRAILVRMVKNFLIENLDIRDNYTTYCGITLTPTTAKNTDGWTVSRATDGTIRNCRIFHASPGYGLVQLHGAQSVHFENIYAEGGVTLRLETGAVGYQTGIFDITAKNVTNENGRCAVMFGPHSAMNGLVRVENVHSISSAYAVTAGKGGVKEAQLKIQPDAKDGIFAKSSYVKNIHAIFGKTAQIKTHAMLEIPEEYYDELNLRWFNKFFEGPSIGAVKDTTGGHYKIRFENITMEGFKYYKNKPILTPADFRPGKWHKELRKWEAARGLSN